MKAAETPQNKMLTIFDLLTNSSVISKQYTVRVF